jgi:Domain of unknown function (DUF3883)
MALELIQNADDAKAEEIIFNITDSGLLVCNSGRFTYCGDLGTQPCHFIATNCKSCDYHRIVDVGSGGKLSDSENIGRFGIGFVSTYQVTDHPEIRASGIKLTLQPERGQWLIEPFEEPDGTSFFLPWADDPNTEARLALGVSHVSSAHIELLAEDFQGVIRKSLLFLRHVRKAEVRRNGTLLLACNLDRSEGSDLIVSFQPSGEVEHWHILRVDAADAANPLYAKHPRLEVLHRSTKISVGLRIAPEPLDEGLLYVFLPTEQSTGLPLHINADFFPESNRKAAIFAGHQHEQAWNEMLIDAAAAGLACDPENLIEMLGKMQLWQLFSDAYDLSSKSSGHPPCFMRFWERLKETGTQARIALAHDGTTQRPGQVFLPRTTLTAHQAHALLEVGGRIAAEELRPYQTAMNQLGAPILTLERLVGLLEAAMARQAPGQTRIGQQRLEDFYVPLWGIVNDLLPEGGTPNAGTNSTVYRLRKLPFLLTEDLFVVTINQSNLAAATVDASRVATLLPRLAIASRRVLDFHRITRLIPPLELDAVVSHLVSMCASEPAEDVIGVEPRDLRDLYTLFADLDGQNNAAEKTEYRALRDLPIWLSSRGLIKATHALLPGNFMDPTGQADLLETSVLTESAREFVSRKLGVQTQTIEAFVQIVLPAFFNDVGPLDDKKYARLLTELANHVGLVNDDNIRRLLGSLPLVPTQDGGWSRPTNAYRRTTDLVKVLGDALHLWLDAGRIPNTRSVHTFIDSLGIRRAPLARHLVDRMLFLAEKYLPTEDAKRASADAFYVLCDHFEEWKEQKLFQEAIEDLRHVACFPADRDGDNWHFAASLHAPFRADAFRSQAKILDFRNSVRLNRELMEKLDISINPETTLVIAHLKHCAATGTPPNVSTYQVLTERAQRADPLISTLAGSQCIFVEGQKRFVRPNQLYWSPQQLGRFAFTIPGNLESFKPLFTAIGVKDAPGGRDFVDILLDIVGEHFEQCKGITGSDRSVYDNCLAGACAADERDELSPSDLRRLQEAPTILNIKSQPTHPDEVLLQDSEWHAGFFGGGLDQALCKPAPELWSFVEKVGVRRLSEGAHVALEFTDGPPVEEGLLANKLMERADILARLLHDKPTTVRTNIRKALSELGAVSYEVVRIQASVHVGDHEVFVPPVSAHAFYDIDNRRLVLARPVGDRIWSHVLNAVFHQLMPEESGGEISKLTLSVRPLMGMSVEEAHRELTDAGIPYLDASASVGDVDDLTSHDLDDLGSSEPADQEDAQPDSEAPEDAQIPVATGAPEREGTSEPTSEQGTRPQEQPSEQEHRTRGSGDRARAEPTDQTGTSNGRRDGQGTSAGARKVHKPRAPHKEQWDRRLLSYVRKHADDQSGKESDGSMPEHNLGVEAMARAAVCSYERAHGRVPEQMAQTHPGYDIISRNSSSGEERFIEVKGVNGDWNQTGVGLSRLQFSNAQDYGNRYWLYVVEFASDPQRTRIFPIRSPATQVTSFMFDGNWREAADDEPADSSLAFVRGARVRHQFFGIGTIESVNVKGAKRVMSIQFETHGRRTVSLNLHTITVINQAEDFNNS